MRAERPSRPCQAIGSRGANDDGHAATNPPHRSDWRLVAEEFDALSPPEQAEVERTTADLCLRYGEDFMRRGKNGSAAILRLMGYL